jgi:peptide-methionine (S)-S-oxide reductase
VLAGGCFWCTEAVYASSTACFRCGPVTRAALRPPPITTTCAPAGPGHAEAIEIEFDPARVSIGQILKIFFSIAHDPTQLNRQGADVGTQYRSTIFYANEAQRRIAEGYVAQIEAAQVFDAPLATTVEPLEKFHVAEAYHHDYAARNPWQPYIRAVAAPKVEKLRKTHGDLLKDRT